MNKNKIITVVLVILLLMPHMCYGKDVLDVETDVGFDGKIRLGNVNPVKISIKALKQDFAGTLIVNADSYKNKIDLDLSNGAQREYELLIPIFSPKTQIKVKIESDEKTVFKKDETLNDVISDRDLMIGVLSDKSGELAYLKGLDLFFLKEDSIQLFDLNKDFYFHPSLMDNFDYIFIDNFSCKSLTKDGQKCISDWVKSGGTIVVGTGPYEYKALTGILEGLDKTKAVGNGFIIKLPWSLGDNSMKPELERLLEQNVTAKLLSKIVNGENLASLDLMAERLKAVSSKAFATSKGTIVLIGVLLLAYFCAVIVCMLVKGKRQTAYLFILIVSLMSYLVANIGVLKTVKAASCGISIYDQSKHSFSLVNTYSQDKGMSFGVEDLQYFKNADGTECFVEPDKKRASYVDEGQHFCFNVSKKDTEADEIRLFLSDDIASGEIVNPLSCNLYKAFILVGDTVIPIGDLKGRQRASIEYKLENTLRNLGDYTYMVKLADAVGLDEYETTLVNLYLKYLDGSGCKLFGFTKDKKKAMIDGENASLQDIRLNVFPINLDYPDEEIILPPQVIKPVFKNKNSDDDSIFEYMLEEDDELVLYYPMPDDIKCKNVTLYTKVEGGSARLAAYNYSESLWEEISKEKFTGESLQDYLMGGPLMVKLSGSGIIIIPQIEVKGVMANE